MSVHVLSWVLRNSPVDVAGHRLVLLVLADYAHDDGTWAWPSVPTIAEKARLSKRAVQYALRALEEGGHIEDAGKSRAGTTVWTVRMDAVEEGAQDLHGGAQSTTPGGAQIAPNPSENHQKETSPNGESKKAAEHPEFGQWLGHHHRVTGMTVLGAGTAGRKKIAGMFGARVAEGFSREDLELATEGAFADDFRREHGHFDPESVLRPTKVAKLVDAGRRARAAAVEAGDRSSKWDAFEAANAAAQGRAA